jgi:hypothetical protein
MINRRLFISVIPLVVYCAVNILFVVKYFSRIGLFPALIFSIAYVVFCSALIPAMRMIPEKFLVRRSAFLVTGFLVLASLIAFWFIKPETLRVDRWSVITSFLDNLFQGKYPYDALSSLGNPPGPFPFYFIVALPFYAMGEIGLLSLTLLVFFIVFLHKNTTDNRTFILQVLLLAFSPAMIWEILARSTIFANFCLVLFYLFWLEKKVFSRHGNLIILAGFVGGLVLSTRALAVIPVICYLSYSLLRKKDMTDFFKMCAGLAAGFVMTFAPLLLWGPDSFLGNNPIVLQSGFLPAGITAGFCIFSCIACLFLRRFSDVLLFCTVVIFCIVGTSMSISLAKTGWHNTLIESGFDISYFIFCIPFAIASIEMSKGLERTAH